MKQDYFIHCRMWQSLLTLCFFICSQNAFTQTQTQSPVTFNVVTQVQGFYESLPVTYATDPATRFPLLISFGGAGEQGNGSTELYKMLAVGAQKHIANGTFPDSFYVDGKWFSYIVVAPQWTSGTCSSGFNSAQFRSLLAYFKSRYAGRVDTTRIYVTGLSCGATIPIRRLGDATNDCNQYAAFVSVANNTSHVYPRAKRIAESNLPIWSLHNSGDPSAPISRVYTWQDSLNFYNIQPALKLTVFPGTVHGGWETAYNPDSSWDGLNVYEWMLQYTNEKLVANAGPDQAITLPLTSITLDGRKSHSRQGQITNYAWTKLSGPSGGIITSPSNDTTIVTSLAAGTYVFELQITHTDASTDKDTVIVSTQTQTAVSNPSPEIISTIGGYYESLPVNYNEDTTKRFPLLMFLHANAEMGNGTTELPELLVSGPPKLLNEGNFPATVILGGQQFSFIVVSPQLKNSSSVVSAAKAMIDYAVNKYRVDTNRIYITGIGLGGLASWRFAGYSLEYADRLAACLLVRPNIDTLTGSSSNPTPIIAYNSVGGSDLPFWVTHASGDNVAAPWKATALVDSVNSRNPDPLAKLTMFSTASGIVDAWTKTYDPASKFWSDSINVYQWMLSYQRSITSPRKANPSATPVLQVQSESSDEEMLNAKISPNPVNAQIKVLITGKAEGRSSLTLYTLQGQRLSQQLFNKENENPVSRIVRTSNLPTGYYSIFVTIGRHQKVVKFIKQ